MEWRIQVEAAQDLTKERSEGSNVVPLDRPRGEPAPAGEASPSVESEPIARKSLEAPATSAEAPPAAAPSKRRSRGRALLPIGLLVVLGAGGWYGHDWWTNGRFMVSTDDAYIHADLTSLSAKVTGYVVAMPVELDEDGVRRVIEPALTRQERTRLENAIGS